MHYYSFKPLLIIVFNQNKQRSFAIKNLVYVYNFNLKKIEIKENKRKKKKNFNELK